MRQQTTNACLCARFYYVSTKAETKICYVSRKNKNMVSYYWLYLYQFFRIWFGLGKYWYFICDVWDRMYQRPHFIK